MMFVVAFLGFMFLVAMLVVAIWSSRRGDTLEKRLAALEEALSSLERRLREIEARPAVPPLRPPAPDPLSQIPVPAPAASRTTPLAPRVPAAASPPAPPSSPSPPVHPARIHPPAQDVSAPGSSPIDWERWIGIRGAAVLGGIVLAIAGLLLFQYSIQHGLITPSMRVGIGIVVGIACLGVSEWLKSLGYRYTPEATSGAGIVILYASFWAAYQLYQLIGLGPAFALMALTTLGCCLLSLRHASQIIAVLGLVGG